MGVLEKKGGHGDKWRVFSISLKWNKTTPTQTYLEQVPLLSFDLLKHNKNVSLKGEHKYLNILDALAYKIPLSSWNTIVFHSCEVVSGNYFFIPHTHRTLYTDKMFHNHLY